jgi:UDP:flavonoid glycosyltransferase YjiC (YdhE family)
VARLLSVTVGIKSHLYSHLALARQALRMGHVPAIASHDAGIRLHVEHAGVEFIPLRPAEGTWQSAPYRGGLRGWLGGQEFVAERRKAILSGVGMPQACERFDPDLTIIDSELHEHILVSHLSGCATASIEFHLSNSRQPNVPILSQFYLPEDTLNSRLRCSLGWQSTRARRRLGRLLRKWTTFGLDKHSTIEALARRGGAKLRDLVDTGQWQHYAFPGIPCLRATVPQMDFPSGAPRANELFVGPLILAAKHRLYDTASLRRCADFLDGRPAASPVIILSLGSMMTSRKVVRTAIAAVTGKPVSLLVSTGPEKARTLGPDLPDNVLAQPWLPLKELLPRAQLMISHGGVATIHESIDAHTPLLLYSLGKMDMNGNAARVHAKGLGIAGSGNDSADDMWQHIERLLTDERFRDSCSDMAGIFKRCSDAGVSHALATCLGEDPAKAYR